MSNTINYETKAKSAVNALVDYAYNKLGMPDVDLVYAKNALLDILKLDEPSEEIETNTDIYYLLDNITKYAIEKGLTTEDEAINFQTRVMGAITPPPSSVIEEFENVAYKEDAMAAARWLYKFGFNTTYIRKPDIDKNIMWSFDAPRGKIDITINLSKPEKTPEQIAKAKLVKSGHPKCMLCIENVGFAGNAAKPARQTLRVIPISLGNEVWYVQFSPYSYFQEHLIAFAHEHRPMKISKETFVRMADFVDIFNDYFIGSNADLPIVGGSILAHDHYQGGAKVLPIFFRESRKNFYFLGYPDVNVSIVDWYNSVVRVESKNKAQLLEVADKFRIAWENYSDEEVDILASTNGERHNTITPIMSMNDGEYRLDMILRNNRTDEKHPYGIYHPTEDMHNIKKEGIGIIEATGRFILPGRLASEMTMIRDLLTSADPIPFKTLSDEKHPLCKHLGMIAQLAMDAGTNISESKASKAITDYINNTCEKILDTTAVFKNTQLGQDHFAKFIESVVGTQNQD